MHGSARETWDARYRERGIDPGPSDWLVENRELLINYLQRDLFAGAAAALAPGGVLLAETVTRAHVETLGRSFDPRFLLAPGELRTAVPGLTVLRFHEGVVERSGRPRAVAGIVAQRPG